MKQLQWRDREKAPLLEIGEDTFCLRMQPIAQEYGGALSVIYQIELQLGHSTGLIVYQAEDVSIAPIDLAKFASDLRGILSADEASAGIAALTRECDILAQWKDRKLTLSVDVVEFQGGDVPDTEIKFYMRVRDTDAVYRWSNALREHLSEMNQWLIANPPTST
jgi:hypothetical protein